MGVFHMAGVKGRSGGARPGAGRKRKTGGVYATAYDFLVAVAQGIEQTSMEQRVAAARAVLPYEEPRRRAPLPSAAPKQMHLLAMRAEEADLVDTWEVRAAEIREEHARSTDG